MQTKKIILFNFLFSCVYLKSIAPNVSPYVSLQFKKNLKGSFSREEKFSIALFFFAKNILQIKIPDLSDTEEIKEYGNGMKITIPDDKKDQLELTLSGMYPMLFDYYPSTPRIVLL